MNYLVSLWDLILTTSLRASALIACIFLLRWLLRGRVPAQFFHLLWLLAAFRFLLPAAPSSATSVFNLLRADATPSFAADSSWVIRKDAVAQPLIAPARTASPDGRAAGADSARAPILAGIWLVGIAVQTVLLGIAGWRMRRALAGATPIADPRLLALARECAETLGLRRKVHLCESTAVAGPSVVGLWRPRLLLPSGLSARLSDEQLRFVLLHECAHLRRHDLAALWLLTAARVVHWFNPLVWLATRAARNEAELACDETVLRHSEEAARIPYGETLLQLTRLLAWQRSPLPLAGILEGRSAIRARVANIATYAAPGQCRSALAALLVLGVGFVFASDERRAPTTSDTSTAESSAPSATTDETAAKPPVSAKSFGPQIEIAAKFIELSDTAILRLKSRGVGVLALRAALRDGPDENVLSEKDAAEFHRVIYTARGVDLLTAPQVTTKSGQRAVIEIIREFRYPTDYDRDEEKGLWLPKAFETRNCGVTLEVEPLIAADGAITLRLIPQFVEFLGFRDLETGKGYPTRGANSGPLIERHFKMAGRMPPRDHRYQPVFSARKHETTITLQPGETVLLASLPETEDVQPFRSPTKAKRLIATISARLVDPAGEPVKGSAAAATDSPESFAPPSAPPALDGQSIDALLFGFSKPPSLSPAADSQSETRISQAPKGIENRAGSAGSPAPAGGPSSAPVGIVRPSDNKPGYVRSPHAPESGLVDVRGFPPGTEIKCPYTGKLFLVP